MGNLNGDLFTCFPVSEMPFPVNALTSIFLESRLAVVLSNRPYPQEVNPLIAPSDVS